MEATNLEHPDHFILTITDKDGLKREVHSMRRETLDYYIHYIPRGCFWEITQIVPTGIKSVVEDFWKEQEDE